MKKSNWNDWLTVDKAVCKEVLVKFKMPDGSFHIEDALIIRDMETDGIYYSLFDGLRGESRD